MRNKDILTRNIEQNIIKYIDERYLKAEELALKEPSIGVQTLINDADINQYCAVTKKKWKQKIYSITLRLCLGHGVGCRAKNKLKTSIGIDEHTGRTGRVFAPYSKPIRTVKKS